VLCESRLIPVLELTEWWKSFPKVPETEDDDEIDEIPEPHPRAGVPRPAPGSSALFDIPDPPADLIDQIVAMGFTRRAAINSLHAMNNNIERAIDWIVANNIE